MEYTMWCLGYRTQATEKVGDGLRPVVDVCWHDLHRELVKILLDRTHLPKSTAQTAGGQVVNSQKVAEAQRVHASCLSAQQSAAASATERQAIREGPNLGLSPPSPTHLQAAASGKRHPKSGLDAIFSEAGWLELPVFFEGMQGVGAGAGGPTNFDEPKKRGRSFSFSSAGRQVGWVDPAAGKRCDALQSSVSRSLSCPLARCARAVRARMWQSGHKTKMDNLVNNNVNALSHDTQRPLKNSLTISVLFFSATSCLLARSPKRRLDAAFCGGENNRAAAAHPLARSCAQVCQRQGVARPRKSQFSTHPEKCVIHFSGQQHLHASHARFRQSIGFPQHNRRLSRQTQPDSS